MLQYGQSSSIQNTIFARSGRVELSIALSDNERTRPLIEGRIIPEGLSLIPTIVPAPELFWRQLSFAEFDISEMSLSSLLIAAARGDDRWVALPIFPMRSYFHTWIVIRNDVGIGAPQDLRGKRVGVPEYQMTAAIWSRGILQHEFGVHAHEIEWFMERNPDKSHGGPTGFTPPPGVRLDYISPQTNIGEMLVEGKLDASLLYLTNRDLVDRSRIDISTVPTIGPLFRDVGAETRRFFAKTGIYPINHTIVIRRSLLEQRPWIALNLYSAFLAAKQLFANQASVFLSPYLKSGLLSPDAAQVVAADPMPYGMKANRSVLETIARYVHEQGLTARVVGLEEIFAKSTMEL